MVKKKTSSDTPLVWSSESGRICPDCGSPVARCSCRRGSVAAGDGVVRVRRETKGRGGKTVTVIAGIQGGPEALKSAAADFKRLCGTGGTVKEGTIEIQGDHRDRIIAELEQKGLTVKRAGG